MFLQLGHEFRNNLIVMCLESLKFGKPGNKKSLQRGKEREAFKMFNKQPV